MRFWKRDLNLGREENYSKRTAGEQRVNISWERVGAEYNLEGVGLKKNSPAQTSTGNHWFL